MLYKEKLKNQKYHLVRSTEIYPRNNTEIGGKWNKTFTNTEYERGTTPKVSSLVNEYMDCTNICIQLFTKFQKIYNFCIL